MIPFRIKRKEKILYITVGIGALLFCFLNRKKQEQRSIQKQSQDTNASDNELEVPSNLFIEVSFPENQQQQSEFTSEGEKTLNSAVFETKVNAIMKRCIVYPPQCGSAKERQKIEYLTCSLISLIETHLDQILSKLTWRDLLNVAELYKAAYNLDLRCAYNASKYSWLREFFGLSPRLEVLNAYEYYERALALRPDEPEIHWKYGEFLLSVPGNKEAAKSHLEKAVVGGLSDAAFELALCYQQLGQVQNAIDCLKRYCTQQPNEKVTKFLETLQQQQQ